VRGVDTLVVSMDFPLLFFTDQRRKKEIKNWGAKKSY
jgi:hypothetical protein